MTLSRKQVLLAVLSVLLLPVMWRGSRPAPPAELPELSAVPAVPAPRVRAMAVETVEELRSASLRLPPGGSPGRDPWHFVEAPAVSAVSRAGSRAGNIRAAHPEPVSAVTEIMAPVPPPAPFPWRYLGTFGPAGRRIAVFADPARRGEVHNAREGETLTQGFVLERIGNASVDVRRNGAEQPAQRLLPGGRTSS